MLSEKELKRYHKKSGYSYAFGSFPTFELLRDRPDTVERILIHSTVSPDIRRKLETLCGTYRIPLTENDRTIEKIREKDSCLAAGVFRKYEGSLNPDSNHVVLINPGDFGNLGTIIRTCVGFGIRDLAIVEPAADIFHPRTIRASMGALFGMDFRHFPDFQAYCQAAGVDRTFYPFMLKGARKLGTFEINHNIPYSLIFGNESRGLDDSFLHIGQSVLIAHSPAIDSLNLSLASGIALYEFTRKAFKPD